ncbi:(Fe-S)-binding protein [Thiobacter aerophilum]|uniref:(Fe-S)-binding protein n=1 Tax=Thiobacter aerophilum TaxID=3121275 RepID=A0ABV0EFF4_9BURK
MRVGLFVTCLVDLMRPSIGFAALRLLEAAGCQVVVPAGQTCCGQPGYNSGDFAAARRLALRWVEDFADCDYVVAPSGSCAAMMRVHYPRLFPADVAAGRRLTDLAARTWELTRFLVEVLRFERPPGTWRGVITYHDSCSGLRELGVKNQPRNLLARMPGVILRELENCETCCGFGGTFSVKFGELSTRMAEHKCAAIQASGAAAVVGGDLGCLMHIEGRLRRRGDTVTRVLHVAEVLAGEQGVVPCK